MIEIREARDADVATISDIFHACYGDDYAHPKFYDEAYLRKLVYTDDTVMLVAEDTARHRVVGTASVILEAGAYTDLVGEFGRLAVHPDSRGRGVGNRLMEGRLERVADRLHVGIVDGRVTHRFTQKISQSHGFAPVGFHVLGYPFGDRRESLAQLVRYFGDALELRRNHPRLVPEVYHLAVQAMHNIGMDPDVVVDEASAPYPAADAFEIQELTTDGYPALLRIERGRVRRREVFGPLSLNYGFFKIRARQASYLIARQAERVVGAIGFTYDEQARNLRVFELIHLDDGVIRFLLAELDRRYREEWNVDAVWIGVSAHAPRLQRTLVELGFLPVSYVPAYAFHRVERIDVVNFMRLLAPFRPGEMDLVSPTKEIAELVLSSFAIKDVVPELRDAIDRTALFDGLSEEQALRVARACGHATFRPNATIFRPGDPADRMFIVLDGSVGITRADGRRVGVVEAGECLGEVALLRGSDHSATATASGALRAGVLSRDELSSLVRQRPDIGVVLYRNLAQGLGKKLSAADRADAAAWRSDRVELK